MRPAMSRSHGSFGRSTRFIPPRLPDTRSRLGVSRDWKSEFKRHPDIVEICVQVHRNHRGEAISVTQQEVPVDCEMPTRVNISSNTACRDDGGFQVSPREKEGLDIVSAAQRERSTQRLASLGEMTGGIVHDVRNILAVIESGLRLAEKYSEEPEKASACFAGVHDGIDRGLKL